MVNRLCPVSWVLFWFVSSAYVKPVSLSVDDNVYHKVACRSKYTQQPGAKCGKNYIGRVYIFLYKKSVQITIVLLNLAMCHLLSHLWLRTDLLDCFHIHEGQMQCYHILLFALCFHDNMNILHNKGSRECRWKVSFWIWSSQSEASRKLPFQDGYLPKEPDLPKECSNQKHRFDYESLGLLCFLNKKTNSVVKEAS